MFITNKIWIYSALFAQHRNMVPLLPLKSRNSDSFWLPLKVFEAWILRNVSVNPLCNSQRSGGSGEQWIWSCALPSGLCYESSMSRCDMPSYSNEGGNRNRTYRFNALSEILEQLNFDWERNRWGSKLNHCHPSEGLYTVSGDIFTKNIIQWNCKVLGGFRSPN